MPPVKKRFGQHFLFDPRILARIADATDAGPPDTVLEIGPGPGGLTAALAERAGRLIAIEKDRDLVPALRARVPRAEIVEGDALELDWHALAGPGAIICGNIPYNITSPLIDKALRPPRPRRGSCSWCSARWPTGWRRRRAATRTAPCRSGCRRWPARSASSPWRAAPSSRRPRSSRPCSGSRRWPSRWCATPGFPPSAGSWWGCSASGGSSSSRGLRELTGWPPERVRALLEALQLDPTARPEILSPAQFSALTDSVVDAGWEMRADL